jgi:hypothetical protein
VRQPFEARSWAARGGWAPWDSAAAQPGSAGVGWETELIAEVHLTERDERERDQLRRREPKRKTYFCGDAIDTRARRTSEEGFGLWGKGGRLGQRPSGPVKSSRAESEK